jgi:hypothetical protein
MSIITNNDLQSIGDKLARFATESVGDPEFSDAFNAGMEKASTDVLSGSNSIAQFLLDLADEDVTADLLPAARDLDEDHPTPGDGFLLAIKGVNSMITALNNHFKRYSYKGLDDYLTSINGATGLTPTLRFHGHFKKYLKTISAHNAFIPTDLDIATFAVTGGAAGTYAHLASIAKTDYAGAKLVLKNVGALTTSPVVTVTGKKWADGTAASLTATISTHTDAHETDLSDTTKIFSDVTNITIASGGTSGDHFKVVAKTDREVSAA